MDRKFKAPFGIPRWSPPAALHEVDVPEEGLALIAAATLHDRGFALATAYRLQCEREAVREEPVGQQRWRRELLEQTRDKVIVFAQGTYGIFHLAEYSLLLGVRIKDKPPGVGTRQQVLTKYGLPARG